MLTANTTTQEKWQVNWQTWLNSKNIAAQCQMKTSKTASLKLKRNAQTNTLIFQLHCEYKCPVKTKD